MRSFHKKHFCLAREQKFSLREHTSGHFTLEMSGKGLPQILASNGCHQRLPPLGAEQLLSVAKQSFEEYML